MRRTAILTAAVLLLTLTACTRTGSGTPELTVIGTMPLEYAQEFSVDYCDGGYSIIHIGTEDTFLLVPEGAEIPAGAEEMKILRQPFEHIYVAAS